jgi:hypothetical protein
MHYTPTTLARVRERGTRHLLRIALIAALFALAGGSAMAQALSGSYDVGGPGDAYASIEAAIADLNLNGVSGPVTFRIHGGTYTPPTGGYVLLPVASMSTTNTVTLKPKAGASVVIDGTLASAIITINGGDHYIIDGSNGTSGTRDLKVINRNTSNSTITLSGGATYNVVRNVHALGVGTSSTDPIIKIYTSTATAGPNAYNVIEANLLGDTTGTIRAAAGYYQFGTSTAQNTDNTIQNNDIVNYGTGTSTGYGIYLSSENLRTRILGNRIRVTTKGTWTGTSYGIYMTNSDADDDVIAGNRIWDHGSTSATASVYGIYISTAQAGRILQIVNNMVSITTSGGSTAAGLYLSTSAAADVRVFYNAFSVTGANAGTSLSYGVYKSSGVNLTLKNNIIVNTRIGTGTSTNRAISVAGTTGTLTSDFNAWYYGSGASSAMGYLTTAYATLAAWQGLGHDANSVQGDPQFVDPANGDLHISTTAPTPVEGKGTPIATWTTDFDGNTRHATRPDIGADEGSFTLLRNNDLELATLFTPAPGALMIANSLFSPLVAVSNAGANTQTGIGVRMIIRDAANIVVYEDVRATGTIASGAREQITFAQAGSVSGTTSLAPGTYTVEVRTELAGDDDRSNDTLRGSFVTKSPLAGTYTINPAAGASATNYQSFTSALRDLRDLGMSASVTFLVAGG